MPPKRTTTPHTCVHCGDSFYPLLMHLAKGKGTFCSRRCAKRDRDLPFLTRLWARVDKAGPVPERRPDLGPCWLWTGGADHKGYGQLVPEGARDVTVRAHRFIYELVVGPVDASLEMDHLCRNRRCVNPAHLEPVTRRENMLRGESFAAKNAVKTHCVHGHPFDAENTFTRPGGRRGCRACRREIDRRRRPIKEGA